MADQNCEVRHYVTEFCDQSEALVGKYEVANFDLRAFQRQFGIQDPANPLFDCYEIKEANLAFLKSYLLSQPEWDFANRSYFLEAEAV